MSNVDSVCAIVSPNEVSSPLAKIHGEPWHTLPDSLYIPPQPLQVLLHETFEGPLDLLLYLIHRGNFDILDIPIAEVTQQYLDYLDMMRDFKLEIAAEYLVMAATLAEIKSRMLLPKPTKNPDLAQTQDPRAALVEELQIYAVLKDRVVEVIRRLPQSGRETFPATVATPTRPIFTQESQLSFSIENLRQHLVALLESTAPIYQQLGKEPISVRERMQAILLTLQVRGETSFITLYDQSEGKRGIVVTFLALLELIRESRIECLIDDEDWHTMTLRLTNLVP